MITYLCILDQPFIQIYVRKVEAESYEDAMEKFVDYVTDDSNAMIEEDNIYCFELNGIATL